MRKVKRGPRQSDDRSKPVEPEVPRGAKVKGAAQMVAGGVLAAAGVPMCILPGPGVAAIAGGVALISRGQRTFSGRASTKLEERLDQAAHKAGVAAKQQAVKVARKAGRAAVHGLGTAARAGGRFVVRTVGRTSSKAGPDPSQSAG